jgi:hypothetical protein
MNRSFDPGLLFLVAIIKEPRDLEIARLLGWYRIPLRSAPKVVAVDYLAFYQTGAFGEDRWRIQYIAPVNGFELTTRMELLKEEPDHPHARHEYYKIQLGALQELAKPILADKWRRITFLYTTGEYINQAETISDLVVQSEQRSHLWKALWERAGEYLGQDPEDQPEFDLDPDVLAKLLGIL